jgi:hypothetical protein
MNPGLPFNFDRQDLQEKARGLGRLQLWRLSEDPTRSEEEREACRRELRRRGRHLDGPVNPILRREWERREGRERRPGAPAPEEPPGGRGAPGKALPGGGGARSRGLSAPNASGDVEWEALLQEHEKALEKLCGGEGRQK